MLQGLIGKPAVTDTLPPRAPAPDSLGDTERARDSATAAATNAVLPRGHWLGMLCGLLAAAIWGGQSVASRQSVADGLTAADVTVLRFAMAALLLLPLALRRMRPFPVGRIGWRRAIVLTLLAGAPYSLVIVGGTAFAPALHASVISPGLIPVFTAVLAYVLLGERMAPSRLAGLALVVAGVVTFSWHSLSSLLGQGDTWIGDLLFVLTAFMWTLFGLLARRWQADAVEVTIATCLLSVAALPLIAMAMPMHLLQASASAIALQAVYQGALVGVAALFFYTQSVALLGAQRAALFVPLVPATTAIASATLLGEWPSASEIVGMAIVVAGMTLALRTGRAS